MHSGEAPYIVFLRNNAEFPEEGKFKLKDDVLYTHYTVCGDADDCESTPPATDVIPPQQPNPVPVLMHALR